MGVEAFRFDGKRAVVVGGASGMGRAAATIIAELGADVVVMDIADATAPATRSIRVDLADRRSIDRAVDECGGPVDVLLSCAGVADGTPNLPQINFIGQRHLIERMVDANLMPRGSAIAMISSAGGRGWEDLLDELLDYLGTPDYETAEKWIAAHPDRATYSWSKQAICAYVGRQAYAFGTKGIRINALMPGPTDTPLAQANAELWLTYATDYRDDLGIGPATAEEQAHALVFLCSAAASRIVGASIMADAGHVVSRLTKSFPPAT